jgi:hypothetical protein
MLKWATMSPALNQLAQLSIRRVPHAPDLRMGILVFSMPKGP